MPNLQMLNLRSIDRSILQDRLMDSLASSEPGDDFLRTWLAGGLPSGSMGNGNSGWSSRLLQRTRPESDEDNWLRGATGLFGSLVSGYMGSRAAGRSADIQNYANQAAMEEQGRQFDQTRADLAPYRERAEPVRNQLAMMMGLRPNGATSTGDTSSYQQDPTFNSGYQAAPTYQPGETANALSRYLRPFSNGGR